MTTQLIATNASSGATSSDITLGDGEKATITLFDNDGGEVRTTVRFALEIKDPNGAYTTIAWLTQSTPSLQVLGPAVWRVRKLGTGGVGAARD